jgi:eukaryotic-like serine/threonine-protein kinase
MNASPFADRSEEAGRPDVAALVGKHVGGLTIERVLAEGGIGVVYAARAPGAPRAAFAVKVLQARHAGDAGIERRFEREIEYALRVHHPNVVRALARGRLSDGRPWLATDRLEGSTLGALVRDRGGLPVARALAIADEILSGLDALHAARVVHRDLSPDNVFIARLPDGRERAILLDLGFAHEPGPDTGDGVTADSPGSLVGTLAFMSPEQATRGRAITEQSDLFTAALLVYYALTGKHPFRGGGEREVTIALVRDAPVPVRRERRDVPPALDRILARALAKHPDARWPGAAAMRTALGQVAAAA